MATAATTPVQPGTATEPVINLTNEAEDPNIAYPTVSELLAELDELMPVLDFAHFEDQLLAARFGYIHQLVDSPSVCLTLANLQVPAGIVEEIIECTQRMTWRMVKSKPPIKDEDNTKCEG